MKKWLLLIKILLFIPAISGVQLNETIQNLPDLNFQPNFNQYSGYLNSIFYWYFTAQSKDFENNLIVYLKGEIGCSPIASIFKDVGPYRLVDNGITENYYAWNKIGNLLFLELPTGGGFSQNATASNNDEAASQIFSALKLFLKSFTLEALEKMNLYLISGDYSAEIVALMSRNVLDLIDQQKLWYQEFPLKGLIFNGVWNENYQFDSLTEFAYVKGYTPQKDYEGMNAACPSCAKVRSYDCPYHDPANQVCQQIAGKLNQKFFNPGLDKYNIYDDCYYVRTNGLVVYPENVNVFISSDQLNGLGCQIDEQIHAYLAKPIVTLALQINNSSQKFNVCQNNTSFLKDYNFKNNLPYILTHPVYVKNGIQTLILNGDTDFVYNHIGVERFVAEIANGNNINMTLDTELWWFNFDSSLYLPTVGGYVTQYNSLVYSTIKGAGHWVGLNRPMQSLQIVNNFMKGENYSIDLSKIDLKPALNQKESLKKNQKDEKKKDDRKRDSKEGEPVTRKDQDRIENLPGIKLSSHFSQFSGYLNGLGSHKMHYWFIEAMVNSSTAPLVLWLNGGPGDSSLYGMFYENGPFLLNGDGTLRENPFSWNQFVNILYLESPVGVGFSYTEDPTENVTWSDTNSMEENYSALLDFLNVFSEYKNQDLYLIGESHGGIFVSMLASKVINAVKSGEMSVNFKGFATANGVIDYRQNLNSMIHVLYYHGLMPNSVYMTLLDLCCPPDSNEFKCQFSDHVDFPTFPNPKYPNDTCFELLVENVWKYYENTPNNGYNIYQDCYRKSVNESTNMIPVENAENEFESYWCHMEQSLRSYLRRDDVRQALHIPSNVQVWQEKSIINDYQRQTFTTSPYFEIGIDAGIKMLIYNGDTDLHCNHLGSEWFASELAIGKGLQIKEERTEWYYQMDEFYLKRVAGYVTKYQGNGHDQGLDVVTIKGGGHLSGTDRPAQLFQLIYNFINGSDYSIPVHIDPPTNPTSPSKPSKSSSLKKFWFIFCVILLSYHWIIGE